MKQYELTFCSVRFVLVTRLFCFERISKFNVQIGGIILNIGVWNKMFVKRDEKSPYIIIYGTRYVTQRLSSLRRRCSHYFDLKIEIFREYEFSC